MTDKLIFSGIQPTGSIHLGAYLGAIKNWVELQNTVWIEDKEDVSDYKRMFCIMDLHAITVPQDPTALRDSTISLIATYIACGLDPEKIPMYAQSQVPEHTELAWILGCLTPMGWLNRMTQFKSKAGPDKEKAGLGLYAYPVLMAADILIYKASFVPVGEDQIQHVELARDIAGAFNRAYGEYFPLPQVMRKREPMRIMSLRDATSKMSKSDPSDASRINLVDSDELIASKIKRAVTDSIPEIYYDAQNRPAVANLLAIYSSIAKTKNMDDGVKGMSTAAFKGLLSEALIAHLSPIRNEINRLLTNDRAELERIMQKSASDARSIAKQTITDVRKMVGLSAVGG